jgi:hypothetical protein
MAGEHPSNPRVCFTRPDTTPFHTRIRSLTSSSEKHGSLAAAWVSLLDQARRRSSSRSTVAQTLAQELKLRLDVLLAEISAISERSVKHCKSLQVHACVFLGEYVYVCVCVCVCVCV